MKTIYSKTIISSLILFTVSSCKKGEHVGSSSMNIASETADSAAIVSDSISSVATLQMEDKKFIKTADLHMEVKDVYDATISIEKTLKDIGGFVTSSRLNTQVVNEETYNTSDENAILVRKFQTENTIQVRVPSDQLGDFLQIINDKKLFLNSRTIQVEDVTSNIKLAELEAKSNAKTAENITKIKTDKSKVKLSDDNMSESNYQKIATLNITDQLKYSTVNILLKEPKLRIAEIAVTNTRNIDNKYKSSFQYDVKNAFIEGFYLVLKIIIGLVTLWPVLLIAGFIFYFLKKKKSIRRLQKQETPE